MICTEEVPQGTSINFSHIPTAQLRQQLNRDRKAFAAAGGRGVELAERIDCAEAQLRDRAFKTAVDGHRKRQPKAGSRLAHA